MVLGSSQGLAGVSPWVSSPRTGGMVAVGAGAAVGVGVTVTDPVGVMVTDITDTDPVQAGDMDPVTDPDPVTVRARGGGTPTSTGPSMSTHPFDTISLTMSIDHRPPTEPLDRGHRQDRTRRAILRSREIQDLARDQEASGIVGRHRGAEFLHVPTMFMPAVTETSIEKRREAGR